MFWNKKKIYPVYIDSIKFDVENLMLVNMIERLKNDNLELKRKMAIMTEELKEIKPIIEHKDFKPALSKECADCRFVIMHPWNHEVLGCRKDNLCEDFKPLKE